MTPLEQQACELLKKNNISFIRVYEYVGCNENCGPLPRVIIERENEIPICYHIDELKEKYDQAGKTGLHEPTDEEFIKAAEESAR
jgi:hypothetical protein